MTGYLHRLVERALGTAKVLEPRPRSRYEPGPSPPGGSRPFHGRDDGEPVTPPAHEGVPGEAPDVDGGPQRQGRRDIDLDDPAVAGQATVSHAAVSHAVAPRAAARDRLPQADAPQGAGATSPVETSGGQRPVPARPRRAENPALAPHDAPAVPEPAVPEPAVLRLHPVVAQASPRVAVHQTRATRLPAAEPTRHRTPATRAAATPGDAPDHADDGSPTVVVTIGRVEVLAATAPATGTPGPGQVRLAAGDRPDGHGPELPPLEDYLQQRAGRG